MRMPLGLVIAAGGLLAAVASAQVVPPPPGGGLMRVDANHDGAISRAEMIADAQARFAAMDTDKDGKVTGDEREAARGAMRAQRPGGGQGGRGGFGGGGMRGDPDRVVTREEDAQRAGARFDRLDANHDGKLDAAEIPAMRPMRGMGRGGDMPPAPPAAPVPAGQ